MYISPKKDCPHVLKDNLISIEKFKEVPFDSLKCQKCDEKTELWICLHCGLPFCSRYINKHFVEHNKENKDHLLCLGVMDLSVWCYECTKDNQNEPEENRGYYIESEITNEYVKIYANFKFSEEIKQNKIITIEKDKLDKKSQDFKIEKNLCSHVLNDEIDDIKRKINENYDYFKKAIKLAQQLIKKTNYVCFCLSCMKTLTYLDNINKHYEEDKHRLYLNIFEWNIICKECNLQFDLSLVNDILKYRILFHLLYEIDMQLPKVNLLSKKEIFDLKYNNFVKNIKNKKYSKILFMVGAGISTSAGIPDFRSSTGLFKQLQDKYNLSSPEEFFYKTTFLKNPQYFYEFTKLFDLSQIKPTISHKFMNFLVSKNIVKYVFTQNIDGLEKKAKIPDDKLVFAHGNFYTGHCAKCNKEIDIKLINEGIEKGEIYYCPVCKGPCKPKVVFYGENLPDRFYEKQDESNDVDLIIIMGTSLKVQPFASVPFNTNPKADIVVFNMEKVGTFPYDRLYSYQIFIQGKTDEKIIQFLKDTDMINEFKEFIKKEYNEDLNVEEETNNIESLTKDINNLDINK